MRQADNLPGGGDAKKLKGVPPGVRPGHNLTAFRGRVRVWSIEHVPTPSADGEPPEPPPPPSDGRVI